MLPFISKPCASGCERHGNCNTELGRCDCPPFFGGADCAQPLFSACAALPGLKQLVAAPCVYDSPVPVSCECLRECEAIGLMGVRECYVIDESNGTTMDWVRRQRQQRGLEANMAYWSAALAHSEVASVRECSGRGVFAPQMPKPDGAPSPQAKSRCHCYAGYQGARCENDITSRPTSYCLNSCSGRGSCVRNWCHCTAGYYGVDCSVGHGGAVPGKPLRKLIGAQSTGAPRIYVYELPPRFNSWMHAGAHGWWQDLDLWGEDVVIHRRLLASSYRVTDPNEADYFFVPVWVSSAMWQMNWGFRDLLPTGVRTVGEALRHIRTTYPFYDRHGGKDHIWVFGHDQGGWRVRAKLPEIKGSIFISPFGAKPAQRGGHLHNHDIVVPPLLYQHVPLGLLNHAGRMKVPQQTLAFFQGKLNLHIPYEYSFGIRQGLYKAFRSKPELVLVREGHEANKERYFEHMSGSKFCVAAAGFGFSTRAYEAAAAGCVPLIMQDGIEQAFEEILPWGLFSLRMNHSLAAIATLDQTLASIPQATVDKLRAQLYCAWPRLLWLRHDEGAQTPLPGQQELLRFDAFESVMWTLRHRLRGGEAWPLDWGDGCRAVQRYFSTPPSGMHKWAPWANYHVDAQTLEQYMG